MSYALRTLSILTVLAGTLIFGSPNSEAAKPRKSTARKSMVGEAMRPKKSLNFDGRTIEGVSPGKYDSFSHLADGDGKNGGRHLYDLPKDFAVRTTEVQSELRYTK